ncbi:MAG: hypothetical protein JHC95_02915, partial [Solirubrobacteraceae bacterium]|nr:hypothetical protein [Solirubrobacteraceae bacterium]
GMTSETDGRGQGSGGILRRAWLPALCGLVLSTLLFVGLSGREKSYETCANLRINSGPVDQAVLGLPAADKPVLNLVGETAQQIGQASVARRAIRILDGKPYSDPDDLLDATSAKPDLDSGLIAVCAKAKTPRQAQRVANATARAYVLMNREGQKANLRAARKELQRLQKARIARLRRLGGNDATVRETIDTGKSQIERLLLAERINTDSVIVATPADRPGGAAGIPVYVIAFLGFIVGAALGGAVLVVRELADTRIGSIAELEQMSGAPVLAVVRRKRLLKRRRPLEELRRKQAEPFRLLYARLCNSTSAEGRRTIVIASVDDDGASGGIAWYLGATAAVSGARVLLLETDPDRPSAVDTPEDRPAGIADVLAGHAGIDEVVFHVAADAQHAVDVLPPGTRNGAGPLRDRQAIEDLVNRAASGYDHVFVDVAPVTEAGAVPFVRQAEGALLVYRHRGPDRDELRAAVGQLAATGTPLLGIIAVGFVR